MFVFSWSIFHMLSTDFGLEEWDAGACNPHTLQHSSASTAFTPSQADPALWTLVMLSLLTLIWSHPFLPLRSHHWICEGFTYQFFIPDLKSWKIEQDKGGVHFTLQYSAQSLSKSKKTREGSKIMQVWKAECVLICKWLHQTTSETKETTSGNPDKYFQQNNRAKKKKEKPIVSFIPVTSMRRAQGHAPFAVVIPGR